MDVVKFVHIPQGYLCKQRQVITGICPSQINCIPYIDANI